MNATAPQPSTNAKTVTMSQDKVCKGSIRYAVSEADAATACVGNVYVEKGAFAPAPMPTKIKVTVEPAD